MNKIEDLVRRLNNNSINLTEVKYVLSELLNEKVTIKSKKGKGDLILTDYESKIIARKPQKQDNGEIKWLTYEINREELDRLLSTIRVSTFGKSNNMIESPKLAERFYLNTWKNIFSNRKRHNHFTIMLNILEVKGLIVYKRSGKVILI